MELQTLKGTSKNCGPQSPDRVGGSKMALLEKQIEFLEVALMFKVSLTGKDQCDAGLVGGGNNFIIFL